MSNSLWLHGLQHDILPHPSLSPGVSQIHINWLSQWCYLTISSSIVPSPLPAIFPTIRVFSNESTLHIRWPKYWSFNVSISPSNEHTGLISSRFDCLDLAVQGTLESSPEQFESISPSALGLLYGPTVTSIHDYWKNHSFGYRGCEVKWKSFSHIWLLVAPWTI